MESTHYTCRRGFYLLSLANGKPVAPGEVGRLPTPDVIKRQPRWPRFTPRGDPSSLWAEREAVKGVYESEAAVTPDKLPWVKNAHARVHYPVMK